MNKKKATVYTVAKHAGVSIATVSRTLTGSLKVAPETRQRVMQAAEDLNFEPNPSARRLAHKKTETVALVFPDLSGPYYSAVIRGAEREAGKSNHNLLIYGTHGKDDSGRFLRSLISKVDGMIIMSRSIAELERARQRTQEIVNQRLTIEMAEEYIRANTGRPAPYFAEIYLRLGELYEQEGDQRSAIEIYRDVIDLFPGRADLASKATEHLTRLNVVP